MARLFVNQLTVLDCAVLDSLRGLLGRSWIVDIALEGALDELGMVFDFGPAKRTIKHIIDTSADHKLIVPAQIPGLTCRQQTGTVDLEFADVGGQLFALQCPEQALAVLDSSSADPRVVAAWLETQILAGMPDNVTGVTVRLQPEAIDGAQYSYCHGLKKHAGHCQRIAHGHRSRIEIHVDGVRDTGLEDVWAGHWQDVFLGNRADLVNAADNPRLRFAYTADEGHFELALPASRCALLETDTTVENIAAHIAQSLKRDQPNSQFLVRAFEGANKGAEATA